MKPENQLLRNLLLRFLALGLLATFTVACGGTEPIESAPALPAEIVFYDWSDDYIAESFDAFTAETGIAVRYETFVSTEEAAANMEAGEVYDVVVMENQFIQGLVEKGLLAKINFGNIPNFSNISPNFRDLAYDPGNEHAIPYSWGTTGLVARTDLVDTPVTGWSDMWSGAYAGQVLSWATTPRFTLGTALLTLGYSVNSEDRAELEAALALLLAHTEDIIWLTDENSFNPYIVGGEAVFGLAWSADLWLAQEEIDEVEYILPREGTILWGDNFVIPANSPNQAAAEMFIDFILRPEVTAEIVNVNYYPMPNDAAEEFISPDILNDLAVYPDADAMANAEILLPLSAEGEALHAEIWAQFLDALQ